MDMDMDMDVDILHRLDNMYVEDVVELWATAHRARTRVHTHTLVTVTLNLGDPR